jgi:hypothetical protein
MEPIPRMTEAIEKVLKIARGFLIMQCNRVPGSQQIVAMIDEVLK